FAAAAEAMRRILVESARRKAADKRGGGRVRVDLADDFPAARTNSDVLAVDEVLDQLAAEDPQVAGLVKLHFFAGLTIGDAAAAPGIARGTASRDGKYARAWLFRRLGGTR